jgi:hypothetical protein
MRNPCITVEEKMFFVISKVNKFLLKFRGLDFQRMLTNEPNIPRILKNYSIVTPLEKVKFLHMKGQNFTSRFQVPSSNTKLQSLETQD